MVTFGSRRISRSFISVVDNRNRKFLFCELMHDRLFGGSSADVMLEIDEERYRSAIASIFTDQPMSAPSRADIISTVHGGLMTREMKAAVEAAKAIDASVYLIDRPYRITQNRLAEKVLNPYVFANMFNYGKLSLMHREKTKVTDLERFLKKEASPIYKVLIEERAQYMARLIHEQARDDETTVIVCSQLHVPLIRGILSSPDVDERVSKIHMAEISRKGLPLWPILVFVYLVIPVGLAGYLWMLVMSSIVSGVRSFIV